MKSNYSFLLSEYFPSSDSELDPAGKVLKSQENMVRVGLVLMLSDSKA